MPTPPATPPPSAPVHVEAPELIEDRTDHGEAAQPDTDDVFSFEVPMPPEFDTHGKPTAFYGYEFKVALWRSRITDANRAILRELRGYRVDEKNRHDLLISAIKSQGSWWRAIWDAVKVAFTGMIDIMTVLAGNENGQLKYFALVLIGLAAIANGIAFSGLGFSAESAVKCGRGTEEHDGRCEVILDADADALEDVMHAYPSEE